MKGNSWAPLALLAISLLVVFMLIKVGEGGGFDGPQIYRGIFRGKDPKPVASMPVSMRAELHNYVVQDGRTALEILPWNSLIIAAEDNSPLTRSLMRGMAELCTEALDDDPNWATSFAIVQLVPYGESSLFLPSQRVLRIRTLEGARPKTTKQGVSARFRIQWSDGRAPQLGRELLTAAGMKQESFELAVTMSVTDETTEYLWSSWFATFGRETAKALMKISWPDGIQPIDLDDRSAASMRQYWGRNLDNQPQNKVMRWLQTWEEPMARGWGGAISGRTYKDRKMATHQILPMIDDIMSERWQVEKEEESNRRWLAREGLEMRYNQFDLGSVETGYDMRVIEHHNPESFILDLLTLAKQGDENARRDIRWYLLTEAVPQDQRDEVATWLRANNPDIQELALLAKRSDATINEKLALQRIEHIVYGEVSVNDVQAALVKDLPVLSEGLVWNGETSFVSYEGKVALLVSESDLEHEGVLARRARAQIWYHDGKHQRIQPLHVAQRELPQKTEKNKEQLPLLIPGPCLNSPYHWDGQKITLRTN